MSIEEPAKYSVLACFELESSAFNMEMGRRVFGEVFSWQASESVKDSQKILERWALAWERGESVSVGYYKDPKLGRPMSIHVFRRGRSPGWEVGAVPHGTDIVTIAVSETDLPADEQVLLDFFSDHLIRFFDVTRSSWGCADSFDRLIPGKFVSRKSEPHWLIFLGTEYGSLANALQQAGASIEERFWGGHIVRCWPSPFQPPNASTIQRLKNAVASVPLGT